MFKYFMNIFRKCLIFQCFVKRLKFSALISYDINRAFARKCIKVNNQILQISLYVIFSNVVSCTLMSFANQNFFNPITAIFDSFKVYFYENVVFWYCSFEVLARVSSQYSGLENVGEGPNYLVLIRVFRLNPFFLSYCDFQNQLVLYPILTMFCMVNSVHCTNVTITQKKRIYTENPYKHKIIWFFTNIFQP